MICGNKPFHVLASIAASSLFFGIHPAAARAPKAVAVEARFKDRISSKLDVALRDATASLAWFLDVSSSASRASPTESEGVFAPFYELDIATATWRSKCELDIDTTRDSIPHCVIHKLQALTALCQSPGAASKFSPGIKRLLRRFMVKRDKVLVGLGMKRAMLPIGNGLEVWMSEMTPKSGRFDVVVPAHAAATLALVQCSTALKEPQYLEIAEAWFASIEKAWPQSSWSQSSFHLNSILLESFVRMATVIRKGSSFHDELTKFIGRFEVHLHNDFWQSASTWSFSGAHATVLAWQGEKKKTKRKTLAKLIAEYERRWLAIAPTLNATESYTCGPMQGVASLLLKPSSNAASMVQHLLTTVEKDVDRYQVTFDDHTASIAATRLSESIRLKFGDALQGSFLRDDQQLAAEKRYSLRIDDVSQCVVALTRTLELLDTLVGVEVDTQSEDDEGSNDVPETYAASALDSTEPTKAEL